MEIKSIWKEKKLKKSSIFCGSQRVFFFFSIQMCLNKFFCSGSARTMWIGKIWGFFCSLKLLYWKWNVEHFVLHIQTEVNAVWVCVTWYFPVSVYFFQVENNKLLWHITKYINASLTCRLVNKNMKSFPIFTTKMFHIYLNKVFITSINDGLLKRLLDSNRNSFRFSSFSLKKKKERCKSVCGLWEWCCVMTTTTIWNEVWKWKELVIEDDIMRLYMKYHSARVHTKETASIFSTFIGFVSFISRKSSTWKKYCIRTCFLFEQKELGTDDDH